MKKNKTSDVSHDLNSTRILFAGLHSSPRLVKLVHAFLERVKEKVKIDDVAVTLAHELDASPAYRASLWLAVPGPDLRVEQRGATLLEAWEKVGRSVLRHLREREAKRVAARKRPEPRRPSGV